MAEDLPGELPRELLRLNDSFAAEGCRLRLELRGGRLGLRGPLPCRSGGAGLRVQRISFGLPATAAGLVEACGRTAQVRAELEQGCFDWDRWQRRGSPPKQKPGCNADLPIPAGSPGSSFEGVLRQQLEGFEQAFFAEPRRRRNPAGSRSTWRGAYRPYLRRLQQLAAGPPPQELSAALLHEVLECFDPSSRSRQQCGIALAALARHEGLELPSDWAERSGGYGLHAARFRRLPSDAQILQWIERIPNPAWRLAYGLMATYGLRNHEIFFCDLSALAPGGDRVIRVLPASKTGEHQVWPFQPDWVERFGLDRLGVEPDALPPVGTDLRRTTLRQAGRRVAEQFQRYGLPITPYDLRHAWAVRTIHIGLPDTVAARMMGHSVAIHTRTYHHWITRRDQQQAVDAALARRQSGR
ncbi:MAG: site-specific integrase [Cyanobium sp.]